MISFMVDARGVRYIYIYIIIVVLTMCDLTLSSISQNSEMITNLRHGAEMYIFIPLHILNQFHTKGASFFIPE